MEFFSFDSHGLSRKPARSAGRDARWPRRRHAAGSRAAQNQQGRVESLESRRLLAFDLAAAYAQSATPFYVAGNTAAGTPELNQAPQQITLSFSPGTTIDTNSLSAITVMRSGRGGDPFGNGGTGGAYADVAVVPGSIAVDDLPNKNQVVIRFSETLPDDTYRITITNALTGNGGTNSFRQASQSIDLRLDLGAQVVSVVPQPVVRDKTITVASMPVDGDLLTVSVRGKPLTIEFDTDGLQSRAGATLLGVKAGQNDTPAKVAQAIRDLLLPGGNPAAAFAGELAGGAVAGTTVTVTGGSFSPVVSFTAASGVAASRLTVGDGGLTQKRDAVVAWFNANDPLQLASAQNPANYQLFDMDPATAGTLSVVTPAAVSYDAASGTAVLSFTAGAIADGRIYRLQVGGSPDANTKLDKAVNVGSIFQQPVPATPAYATTAFLGESGPNDIDLYKLNLTQAGTITAKATPAAPGFNPFLRLFDATGQDLTGRPGFGYVPAAAGAADTLTFVAPAGDYYLGVSSTGNGGYSAVDGTGAAGGSTTGSYKLEISSTVAVAAGDDNSSFRTATGLGTLGVAGAAVSAVLDPRATVPTPAGNLLFPLPPGATSEPGHRDTPADSGSHGTGAEATVAAQPIPVRFYNFQANYGVDPQGNQLTNLITEDQKQRAREVFDLYSRVTGIRFVESPTSGLTVVTGDMRALNAGTPTDPNGGPIGLGGPSMVVMNSRVTWGSSDEFGGLWFETAMHEIGHALGLDHSYDLPSIMGNGLTGEKVYPGDYDTLHLAQLYPKTGSDIDVYSFTLPAAGTFTAESVVARAGSAAKSTADTVLTLYREDAVTKVRELVARNDDYYGRDSFLSLDLTAGTYYVAVTSTGNTAFNPEVENSGGGGRTDGAYDLKLGFTPAASADTTIVDAAKGVPLDGDRDGVPGGAFNFWFDTAAADSTVYVDKTATALTSTSTWAKGASQLVLASIAGLAAGMKVSGAGIPAGTLIGAVTAGTRQITLVDAAKLPVATTLDGLAATLTFGGTLASPFRTLPAALAAAAAGGIIRVVGNGGNAADPTDDLPYVVGKSSAGATLEDGLRVNVPKGVTLMIDEGAVFKMGESVIDVGSSSPLVDRQGAALQVLGTPSSRVIFTSIHDDTAGKDVDGVGPAASGGQWGGLVLRADSDSATRKMFVNSVTNADLRYGGGSVLIDSQLQSITPLHLVDTRPTLAFNTITDSSGAGISADPNSFEDTGDRIGPALRGNLFVETRKDGPGGAAQLHQNSINGVFVRINTAAGSSVDTLSVPARFTSRDTVYVITENLLVEGGVGGYTQIGGVTQARPTGRLAIDAGVVVKLQGARIELGRGNAQLIAEGQPGSPVVFTSFGDNRYGAGGTFDTNGILPDSRTPGDWGGIMLNAGSKASIDRAYLGFAGGQTPIEGGYSTFDAIEVHEGDLRLANSRVEFNAATTAPNDRTGRGTNTPATIFVRGAQPVLVGNDFRDNAGAVVSINANSLTEQVVADPGRSTGTIDRFADYDTNQGPLVRANRLTYAANLQATVGMVVRAEEITAETVWDDTDIVHVLTSEITVQNFHTATGIRLQSAANASLVIKLQGATAGITAAGYGLDINDRIGGTVQVVGAAGYPVVMTSLTDDTVGASLDASGVPVKDTNNDGLSYGATGQWRGLRFLPLSNDRNVEVVNEAEKPVSKSIDANAVVGTAQVLGTLGPNYATANTETGAANPLNSWDSSQEKGGDDNRRLGFEVHGAIAVDNPRDVDVYSFTGYAGSEVWLDVDKTAPGLDAMLELLDADGNVLARSDDSQSVVNVTNATVYGTDTAVARVKTFQLNTGVMAGSLTGTIYLQGGATQTFTANAAGVLSFAAAAGVPANAIDTANSTFNPTSGVLTLAFTTDPGTGAASVVTSYASSAMSAATVGGALPLTKDPLKGGDAYSVNPRDPGMRVILPGVTGQAVQYYVRVRSQPRQDTATLATYGGGTAGYEASLRSTTFDQSGDAAAGATSGTYELRIRLRQQDEKPGSTVRYADIRFSVVGIDVLGLPRNSPLVGETGESTAANDTPATAQEIGNVLTTDRNTVSVAGALSSASDVDWYTFELNYEQIQAIGGVNAGGKTWSTVFDINYGDGFKGDYTLSVFDSAYKLLYVGRDSNVADDQPGVGQGSDTDDLSRGSFGKLDPFVGPVQLNAGTPTQSGRQTNDGATAIPASSSTFRYYVAVSSTERLPAVLDATFKSAATNALVRLEPVNSIRRVVEDHIGFSGYADSSGANIAPATPAIFDTTTGTAKFTATVANGSPVIYIAPANGSTAGLKPGMVVSGNFPSGTVIRSIDGPQLLTVSNNASSNGTTVTFYDNRLNQNVRQFTLADVTLFGASGSSLFTVDASTGTYETTINGNVSGSQSIGDLDMRPDGRLYAYASTGNDGSNVGKLLELNTGDGSTVATSTDGIANKETTGNISNWKTNSNTVLASAFKLTNSGGTYGELWLVVDDGSGTASKLYRAAAGGSAASGGANATASQGYADKTYGYFGTIKIGGPGGSDTVVTGIQFVQDSGNTMYGVTGDGKLVTIAAGGKNASDDIANTFATATVVADLKNDLTAAGAGAGFQGLAAAPQNLSDGLYRGKFFATTNTGRLVLIDPAAPRTAIIPAAAATTTNGLTSVTITNPSGSMLAGLSANSLVFSDNVPVGTTLQGPIAAGDTTLTLSAAATGTGGTPLAIVAPAARGTGTLALGSTAVTGVAAGTIAPVTAGMLVFGNGIPANTTVVARTTNTITLSNAATTAGAQTLSFVRPDVSRVAPTTLSTSVTLAKTSDLRVGMLVFGAGIPDNTSITNVTPTTITLSKAATQANAATTLSFVNTSSLGYVAEWSAARTNGFNALALSGSPTSIAFSPLDVNLWHPTDYRGTAADPGHGVPAVGDNTRTTTSGTRMDVFGGQTNGLGQGTGGASMAFSLESYNQNVSTQNRPSNVYYMADGGAGQFGAVGGASYNWQQELTANTSLFPAGGAATYNLPGGAYGSVISNPFSLAGYTYTDKPTLYFNYWLQTEDVNTTSGMRDSARVYASTDGGTSWQLLATNNGVLSPADTSSYELPTFPSVSSRISSNTNQRVQQLFDAGTWRQARVDLGDFAGSADIRLRFDFSTAGMFDTTQVDAAGTLINGGMEYNTFGQFTNANRGQNNAFGGFHFDDVIVGFAERGEMVTGATGSAAETTFFNLNTPTSKTVAPQSLSGSYQLEIRRGTEYGVQADPSKAAVSIAQVYDTNVRFVPVIDAPPVTIRADGFEAVTRSATVTLKAAGTDAVTWNGHGLIAGTPLVFSGLPAGSGLVAGNTYYLVNPKANTFDVAATKGGAALTLTAAGTATAVATTTSYSTVAYQAAGTGSAGAVAQYTDVAPHAGTVFAPATGARFAVLTGQTDTDRAQATWDVSLADATALKTAAFLQFSFINTLGQNSLSKTFSLPNAASAPRGNGVAISVDGGLLWTSIHDLASTPYGDAVPTDGLPYGNGVPPDWKTVGIDLMAALTAAGYAAGTRTTAGQAQVTVPSTASLVVGMTVTGADIPGGATITSIDSKTGITLSAAATATAAGKALTFTPVGGGTAVNLPGTVRIGFFQSAGGGFVAIDDLQLLPAAPTPATGTIGDRNQPREQGQFVIANNVVSDARTYGISIDAGVRDQTSNLPHPGVPANLRNPNTGRLVPGAVIVNNIVAESGTAGIRFSGDPDTTMPSAVPYGRIVNNTIFGGATLQAGITTNKTTLATVASTTLPYLQTGMTVTGAGLAAGTTITAINVAANTITLSVAATAAGSPTATFTSPNVGGTGVLVSDNAAPTLLNNVLAQLALGVSVDATSRIDSASNLRTVIGANAYYQVGTQIGGTTGLFQNDAITVTVDPFVKSYAGNFYPAAASGSSPSIIDSSLDTLQDRNEYRAVVAPLGIPASPIIAPALDIYGQLRADDPAVASSPGLGANPFKDRGAVDRVDTKQPTAALSIPLDGSAADKAAATGVARLVGSDTAGVYRFVIQLTDEGIGIDNTTVLPTAFTVRYVARSGVVTDWANPPQGVTVQTLDATSTNGYVFRYLENTKQVVLESNASFSPGDYLITVDNTQIADLAGRLLLNNDVNGTGTTAFKIALVDIPASPTALALATAPAVESGKLSISWTAPAYDGGANVTGYLIQTSLDNLAWTTVPAANLVQATPTTTAATITGLVNATPYYVRVAAINSANGGTPADTTQINWSSPIGPIAPLAAPVLTLRTDSGDPTDGITNDARVNVALDNGVTVWQYSIDGGAWQTGAGTFFTLPADRAAPGYALQARQTLLGFTSPVFTLAKNVQVDTVAPAKPGLALGTGIGAAPAGGATAAEATQATGAVTVTGEAGATIVVRFTGVNNAGTPLLKNVTGQGTGTPVAVLLTAADLGTLGDGLVTVTASQSDVAGNTSSLPDPQVQFVLDTVVPPQLVVTPGIGVGQGPLAGTTAAEATQGTGVVTVEGEVGAAITVSFTGPNNAGLPLVKTVTGQGVGTPVAVLLTGGDLATLGDGDVAVSATQTDPAGNTGVTSATVVFTLDTGVPAAPAIALVAGVGDLPGAGATAIEATTTGVVKVKGEAGTTINLAFFGKNGNVPVAVVADGTLQTVTLSAADLGTLGEGRVAVNAVQVDVAGNTSAASDTVFFDLDLTPPTAATVQVAPDIVAPIKIPRAVNAAGVVLVTAEPSTTVTLTFESSFAVFVNTVTIQLTADGSQQAVALTRAQIDALCTFGGSVVRNTTVNVTSSVTDPAGNTTGGPFNASGLLPQGSFVLDAVAPAPPAILLAAGAAAATAAEATDPAGIVFVTALAGNLVDVTFTDKNGVVVTIPTYTADGSAQPIVLSAARLALLADGPVTVAAVQYDGNPSLPGTVVFAIDTGVPAAPVVALGTGIGQAPAGGATAAEATQATGVVTVTGESLATITVAFNTFAGGTVTKTVTGQGVGTTVAVQLTAADLATLGDGVVYVSAFQTDAAGNQSPANSTVAFRLDTNVPVAPWIVFNAYAGVAPGGSVNAATAIFQDFVLVGGEYFSTDIAVTFTGTAGSVTKTVTGAGQFQLYGNLIYEPVGVRLTAADLVTLGEGAVSVSAAQTDFAGNQGPVSATLQFTLDTVPPAAPGVVLGTGVGAAPLAGATAAEATQATGVVTVVGEVGASIFVTFTGTAGTVTKTVAGQGAVVPVAVQLAPGDLATLGQGGVSVSAVQTDRAGNTSLAGTAAFTLDTLVPSPPSIALGTGVGFFPAGGATAAEATQGTGVVTVVGEVGATITVALYGSTGGVPDAAKLVTKIVVGQGVGVPVALVLSAADLATLGDGTVSVYASQADQAGNVSQVDGLVFLLDTVVPLAPVVALGTGVGAAPAGGTTAAEATQASGVVTVAGENLSSILVTFTGTAGTVTKTVTGLGTATPVAVVLTAGDLTILGDGTVNVSAIQTDLAGNTSPAGTATFTLDTVVPLAPIVALGTGVGLFPAGGATTAEATQASGVVTVVGENLSSILVTFTGTAGTVTKTVTGAGTATPVAVVLAPADLTTLGQGTVGVSAVQTDLAGNTSPAGTASFTLDTLVPLAPVVALGTGVGAAPAGGTTAAEATQASGVVTVAGENLSSILVTFTGTAGTVTKTVTGLGTATPVAVVLTAGDLTTLGDGTVNVSAVQTDLAGNTSPAGTATFTLDTVVPLAPIVALGTGVGLAPAAGASAAEATQASGVVTVVGENLSSILVTFTGTAGTVTKTVTGAGTATPVAVVLALADLTTLGDGLVTVTARQTDPAGNQSGPSTALQFTLDTVAPAAPGLALGAGVADGATASEALQTAGVVLVIGESGSPVTVAFVGTNGPANAITKTVFGQGPGAQVKVVLQPADLAILGQGAVAVTAVQSDAAGNPSPAATATFTLDTLPPAPPVLAAGTGVAGGATAAEVLQASGVVTVVGEAGGPITVTFQGASGQVVKTVTGQGVTPVAVQLLQIDLDMLGNGPVSVSATQRDPAGNPSGPSNAVQFTIDTLVPLAPALALAAAVGDGATRAEATQPSGVAFVQGEPGATILVRFVGTAGTVTKPVTGRGVGANVPVVLADADLATLGEGVVTVTADQADAAGNQSPAAAPPLQFLLDTLVPAKPVLAVGTGVPGGATRAEATQASGVVTVRGEAGAAVTVAFYGSTGGVPDAAKLVTKTVVGQGAGVAVAVVLGDADLARLGDGPISVYASQADQAGNVSPADGLVVLLDTIVPGVPAIALAAGIADGATRAEATLASGIATVRGEAGATITLFFYGSTRGVPDAAKLVTKTVTGAGTATAVAVALTDADLAVMGDGPVSVYAVQADQAGNVSPASGATFNLDTVLPAAAVLALGAGVANGATAAEATQASGVVTVTGEVGAMIVVTFTGVGGTVTQSVVGRGATPVPVVLSLANVATLRDGGVTVTAVQTDAAGNQGPASAPVQFTIDTVAPGAATILLGTGVADGATRAEATQGSGVVTVTGEAGLPVVVTFVGTTNGVPDQTKIVTKVVPGQGAAVRVPVTLSDADLAVLGDGPVFARAVLADQAGNQGPAATAQFLLDMVAPAAPIVAMGAGVADGATAAEATRGTGVVTVAGDDGATITVTLQGTAGQIVRTVVGRGPATPVAVVLTADDLVRLGNGQVVVSATQPDAAGNTSPAGTGSFILDTVAPTVVSFAAVTTSGTPPTVTPATGTFGSGASIQLVATVSEAVPKGAAIVVALNTGVSVSLVAPDAGTKLVGTYRVADGQTAAPLKFMTYQSGGLTDLAGNPLDAGRKLETATGITIAAAVQASAVGFSSDPKRIPDLKTAVAAVPITFTTAVKGVTLNSFRLLLNGRSVSLTGATLSGSGANWTLRIPTTRTTATGIYTLQVLPAGIKAVSNGSPMLATASIYWGKGASVGVTAKALAFAGI